MERKKRKEENKKTKEEGSRTRENDESVLTLPPLPPFKTREREKQAQQEEGEKRTRWKLKRHQQPLSATFASPLLRSTRRLKRSWDLDNFNEKQKPQQRERDQ
jgi:hypothetical protein